MFGAVRLIRNVSFSSGHRYWLRQLSEADNRELFGRWASPFNHGHNYELQVGVDGPVDSVTGMVVNIKDVDEAIRAAVVAQFDQKSINDEIPFFEDRPPTVENLLLYLADELRRPKALPERGELGYLKLIETPLLYGEWERDLEPALKLTRTYEFCAAHRLHVPTYSAKRNEQLFGKCNNPSGHGHNYVLEVTVEGEADPQTGMMVDIGKMDDIVDREVVERYDHKNLNLDLPDFAGSAPTSEVVVSEIFRRLSKALPVNLARVRLHETARSVFEISA